MDNILFNFTLLFKIIDHLLQDQYVVLVHCFFYDKKNIKKIDLYINLKQINFYKFKLYFFKYYFTNI